MELTRWTFFADYFGACRPAATAAPAGAICRHAAAEMLGDRRGFAGLGSAVTAFFVHHPFGWQSHTRRDIRGGGWAPRGFTPENRFGADVKRGVCGSQSQAGLAIQLLVGLGFRWRWTGSDRDFTAVMRAVSAINARWAAIRTPESARQRLRNRRSRRDFGGSGQIRGFWPLVKKMMGLTLASQAIVRVYWWRLSVLRGGMRMI